MSSLMMERAGMAMQGMSMPGMGTAMAGTATAMPHVMNWLMVPRCTLKMEKCSGGMKIVRCALPMSQPTFVITPWRTSCGRSLNITTEADLPSGGRFEKDAAGKTTGAVTGGQGAIIALFDRLPRPTFDQQVEGTQRFFRELNRLALTGVVDPGGNNLTPDDYQALFKVWRDGRSERRWVARRHQ